MMGDGKIGLSGGFRLVEQPEAPLDRAETPLPPPDDSVSGVSAVGAFSLEQPARDVSGTHLARGHAPQGLVGLDIPVPTPNPRRAERIGAVAGGNASEVRDTGQLGPYRVRLSTIELPVGNGKTNRVNVFAPVGEGPFHPAIFTTGLFSNQNWGNGNGTHFASHGILTLVPDLSGNTRPSNSAELVKSMVDWLGKRGPQTFNITMGRGVGLAGHSFGGLTAIMASVHRGVAATVALDPNDNFGNPGRRVAPNVSGPVLVLRGGNGLSREQKLFDALPPGNKYHYSLPDAGHFDFVSKTTGAPKNDENRVAMRFATGFMLSRLTGQSGYERYVGRGPGVMEDVNRGALDILYTP